MKLHFAFFAAALAWNTPVQAQEETNTNSNQVKLSDVAPVEETQKDIDQEITNARLRATLGSKSKWSVKTALAYSGGSVEKPFDQIRPNYRAGAELPALTTLSGTVGVKYSVTNRDSISFGSGITIQNPFHGDLNRSTFENPAAGRGSTERYNAATPYVDYSRAYKVGTFQMVSSTSYSHYTESRMTEGMNAAGYLAFSQTVLADLGTSSWSAGAALIVDTTIYKGGLPQASVAQGARQADFSYGIFPFAEYGFNDKYSFRTVFGYFQMTHYKDQTGDSAAVQSLTPYQSMGVGMALTRDFYLYPNLQFTPLDIRPERTNVALSANINAF